MNHTNAVLAATVLLLLPLGFSLKIASTISIEILSFSSRCSVESVLSMEGNESWEIMKHKRLVFLLVKAFATNC